MANYRIIGQVQDESMKPIPFAEVYVTDMGGKPKTGKNKKYVTTERGAYTLEVTDNDYITARMVGYEPTTKAVKGNIVFMPNPITGETTPTTVVTLSRSLKTSLPPIEKDVIAEKQTEDEIKAKKEKTRKTLLIVGVSVVGLLAIIGIAVYLKRRK